MQSNNNIDIFFYNFSRAGHAFTSYTYEPGIALPIMYEWLKNRGVNFQQRKIGALEELKHFDLVVNASGCGARYLVQGKYEY